MTSLRVAGLVRESIVDGPGLRCTVFVQGCPLACVGCHNPATWDSAGGTVMTVDQIAQTVLTNPLLSGLTLSGGEPTAQAAGCAELADLAKKRGLTVWSYSGYRVENLLRRSENDNDLARLLSLLDVLVDGPFVLAKRNLQLPWRGSNNQRLVDMPATLARGCCVTIDS